MAKRAYVSFAEVKEKVPIPDALQKLVLLDRFSRKGDALTGVCPLPAHVHGPSPNAEQFKINRKDGVWLWHCFGDCQRGGNVIELIKSITGFDDAHVRFWFAEHFADRLTLTKPVTKQTSHNKSDNRRNKKTRQASPAKEKAQRADIESNDNLPDEPSKLKPLRFYLDLSIPVPYLEARGLSEETVLNFGLGLCRRGVLKGYLAIPIYGYPHLRGANPVAYLGRWPGEDYDEQEGRPRYKWPKGFPKSDVVYGLNSAMDSPADDPLIVVEGVFGVWHLFQAGYPSAVAIFGSALSDAQATLLVETGRRIVLLFDGDEAGRQGMRAAAGKLITRAYVRAVKLPEGKQPDGLTADELRGVLPA